MAANTGKNSSLNRKNLRIYRELAEHQMTDESWELRELAALLQEWMGRFDERFNLRLDGVALCIDRLPKSRYGHFRRGANGFGLRGEIAINRLYLDRPTWQILGTLFHEQLHAWQEIHGSPGKGNFHNNEFRAKAASYGLIIDKRGYTEYEPNSEFLRFLSEFGVDSENPRPEDREGGQQPGKSKLKKWTCSCTPAVNVRVAIAGFKAQCLICGQEFKKAD